MNLTCSLIQRFEAFSPTAYTDVSGHPTIGYGHLITADEQDLRGQTLSMDDGLQLLQSDIDTRANIASLLDISLFNEAQIAALTSLCFNIGMHNFKGSSVKSSVKTHGTSSICEGFSSWRRTGGLICKGLIKRRFTEIFLFLGQTLDVSDEDPSIQWNLTIPVTDINWNSIDNPLRMEAIQIYKGLCI